MAGSRYIKDKELLNCYLKQQKKRVKELINIRKRRVDKLNGFLEVNKDPDIKKWVRERNQILINDLREDISEIEDELLKDFNINKNEVR